ncbi:hypothetical protein TNIN_20691 [Trichonephila inaurata madagascariensis]|uniref:Uncharacterized protein n=1 Tax=Trichonephila inaurata madagascariensis TaxID=2747483 RepID=A0A8X6JWK6_9ARAC|nr:hypothetical protein TNIN_20691 [Trichonephila inaurata madagascariensis]
MTLFRRYRISSVKAFHKRGRPARINKLSSTTPVISPVCIIEYKTIFHQGGEASPFIEHYIDTQSHLPVSEAKEVLQEQQDKRKSFAYQRTPGASYNFGDIVLLPNQACPKNTGVKLEFMPRHDGSFVFIEHKSPVSYSVANTVSPN